MKLVQIIFIAVIIAVSDVKAQNYYCRLCTNHVMCNPSTVNCPAGASHYKFLQADKDKILAAINNYRNRAAGGQIWLPSTAYGTANAMKTVTWSNELESFAYISALSCFVNANECRSTGEYTNVGQEVSISPLATRADLSTMIDQYIAFSTNVAFGKGAQITHDNAVKIGCFAVNFPSNGGYQNMVYCNWSHGNTVFPSYVVGSTRAGCTASSTTYSNLCA